MIRYTRLNYIQQLDPVRDNWEICRLMSAYEFPWDMSRSLEIALLRTFCVPSISKLLDKSGEFYHHPQKRYDDTGLILAEIVKWGYDSDRGRQAIERMNRIHGHFPISNQDYLYVLSTFIYEPIRWNARFGWRLMSETERLGYFYYWLAVGERMQIKDIPTTYEAFEEYNINYERQHFHYCQSNGRVAEATVNLFLSWFPKLLHPLLQPCVCGLLDERMLEAFGFAPPSPVTRLAIENILKLRGQLQRLLLPRKKPDFYSDGKISSYPEGYKLTDLGPSKMLQSLNKDSPE